MKTETEENILNFTVAAEEAGKRLDAFLAEKINDFSRSRLQKIIADGDCLVNENAVKSSYKTQTGDEIEIELSDAPVADFQPEDIPLEIVHEDEFLAVINKPAGMVVHPGAGISSGTLANAVAFHFYKNENLASPDSLLPTNPRVGIVHRLDKDTSGLIVVAKDEKTLEKLAEQFRERTIYKLYVALVHGAVEENKGEISQPIAREKHNRTKMAVRRHGRHALSLWKVRERFEKFTLLNVEIKTGRTHQIRVHLMAINHPVVGDETYNSGRDKTISSIEIRNSVAKLGRFFLHAAKLGFTHPTTGERLNFSAPLPDELDNLLENIKAND